MLVLVILGAVVLFLILAGFIVIKLWGITKGVKKIYSLISYFR